MRQHGSKGLALRGVRGFTLMELMMVVFIVGLLAAVGIPSFQNIQLNSARSNTVNDLVMAMNLARSESIKQGFPVVVCPMASSTCAPSATGWANGYLVFVDGTLAGVTAADGTVGNGAVDAGEAILKVFTLQTDAVSISTTLQSIAFRPSGSRGSTGTVKFCDKRGSGEARVVMVTASGRIRTLTPATGGADFTCST